MSSTASVVPNVSYHLPKPVTQNFQHFDCGSDGSVLGFSHQSPQNNDYGPTTNFMKSESSISASKLVSYNLDNALRLSLKSSTVPLNGHISNYTEKLSQRPLSFHESSAPPLDSIIKQKIQSLPRSLILEDSEECKSVKKSMSFHENIWQLSTVTHLISKPTAEFFTYSGWLKSYIWFHLFQKWIFMCLLVVWYCPSICDMLNKSIIERNYIEV